MKPLSRRSFIFRIVFAYAVLAPLWIFLSDNLLSAFTQINTIIWLSTLKGVLFIAATTILLYLALHAVPSELAGNIEDEPAAKGRPLLPFPVHRITVYAFAIVASMAILWVRARIGPIFADRPLLILFMLPIILSAMLGGFGPGLIATMICGLGINYLGLAPKASLLIADPNNLLQWIFLMVNGALISIMSESLHRAYRRTETSYQRMFQVTSKLAGSEERLRLALDAARAGTWEWTMQTNDIYWSDEIWPLCGLPAHSCPSSYENWIEAIHPDYRVSTANFVNLAVRQGIEFEVVWRVNEPEGQPQRWLMGRGQPLREQGIITRYLGIVIDITGRKLAQEALQLSEQTYRSLFEHMLDGFAYCQMLYEEGEPVDFIYLSVNTAFERLTGLKDVVGKRLSEVIPGIRQADPGLFRAYGRVLRGGPPETFEIFVDAMQMWFSISLYSPQTDHLVIIFDVITQRKQAEQAAERERSRLQSILRTASDGLHILDATGLLVESNPAFLRMLGEDDSANGRLRVPDWDASASPQIIQERLDALIASNEPILFDTVYRRNDGQLLDVEISACAIEIDGQPLIWASARDITERKRNAVELLQYRWHLEDLVAQRTDALSLANEQLRIAAVAFQSRDGMLVTDSHGVILQVNQSFTDVTGYSAADAIGHTPAILRSGRHDDEFFRTMWEAIQREGYWQGKIWNRRKDGGIYPEWLAISTVRDKNGLLTHYFGEFSNISEPREAERKILELAFYDPLTGLPNRRLLLDRLHQALGSCGRNDQYNSVLLIDLDHFKTLNDTRGHEVGDRLLIEVARRLRTNLRDTDTAARLGGDEFVVLLEDMGKEDVAAATNAEIIADKLRLALAAPYDLDGVDWHASASVGITVFCDPHERVDNLLKQADLALYQAKYAGRNTIRFYNPAMQAAVDARATMEAGLRRALANDEFLLYYQPQVDGAGRLIGAEALLRWQPPDGPMISPVNFIPVAEESGLILAIGNWVLVTACAQIAAWSATPATCKLKVAVNISARQFRQPDFVDRVLSALQGSGADPRCLKLEVTESSVIENMEEVIQTMRTLKAVGTGFSMDDFGTGYSSLANLKRLPLDQLKIDQSFVRDIPASADDCAIAQAIIAMGRSLHLHVIAEGVETEAQRQFLARHGCLAYQGFLFGRPGPAAAIVSMAQDELPTQ